MLQKLHTTFTQESIDNNEKVSIIYIVGQRKSKLVNKVEK